MTRHSTSSPTQSTCRAKTNVCRTLRAPTDTADEVHRVWQGGPRHRRSTRRFDVGCRRPRRYHAPGRSGPGPGPCRVHPRRHSNAGGIRSRALVDEPGDAGLNTIEGQVHQLAVSRCAQLSGQRREFLGVTGCRGRGSGAVERFFEGTCDEAGGQHSVLVASSLARYGAKPSSKLRSRSQPHQGQRIPVDVGKVSRNRASTCGVVRWTARKARIGHIPTAWADGLYFLVRGL